MELRAQDLRIGNWVNIGYDCKIVRIDEFGATLNTHLGVKELLHFHEKDIRPIPLTEEILLKCGFVADAWAGEEESNFYYIPDDDIMFSLNNDFQPTQDGFEICNYKINYLHELQNAYRFITGQELNVKL